jgi:Tfp pilus assembly protein PilX
MRYPQRAYRYHEQGATALVVVMFSVLLFAVVVVGFMQLMVGEQSASNDNELSRGAYDSALAGVEDGKRVLQACFDGDTSACDVINANKCSTTSDAGLVGTSGDSEVYLKSTSATGVNGESYEQAYTCVKVALNTPNYLGYLSATESSSVVIPLVGESNASYVNLEWYSSSASGTGSLLTPPLPTSLLVTKANWPAKRPPVMRVELINMQPAVSDLSSQDSMAGQETIYLYPRKKSAIALPVSYLSDSDVRNKNGSGGVSLQTVGCDDNITSNLSGYVCNATLTLPAGLDTTPTATEIRGGIYLRVTALYNSADFSATLQDGAYETINYVKVQPSIDSTGRAADVFRRVEARVESTDDMATYPRATIDITNNLCKVLSVTDTYSGVSGSCTP